MVEAIRARGTGMADSATVLMDQRKGGVDRLGRVSSSGLGAGCRLRFIIEAEARCDTKSSWSISRSAEAWYGADGKPIASTVGAPVLAPQLAQHRGEVGVGREAR